MNRGAAVLVAAAAALSLAGASGRPRKMAPLPAVGTRLSDFPPGPARAVAQRGCLQCHSADIPRQQRLTEKQWTASVEKMMRWGADVPEKDKEALVRYLAGHFGPDNDSFEPVVTRPAPTSPR